MYLLLNTFWAIWIFKYVLFWLYLWQLKDYHIGRFIDHFRTEKGRKIIFSPAQYIKLILLILFLSVSFLFNYWLYLLFFVYIAEFISLVKAVWFKSFKRPIMTFKMMLLVAISFSFIALFLFLLGFIKNKLQPVFLIGFDILVPLIISFIVLIFQPIFVLIRNNKLVKAAAKMKEIKSAGKLKVIAVTGSYGKTTTKEFLTTILSRKFKVLNTKEHQNSEIGIAKCILNDLDSSHQILIAEVGAYNKGKVKQVCSMLSPEIGIVTGVNEQHIALFGSMDNLLSAEGGRELKDALPKNGTLIINGDNKYCLDLIKRGSQEKPAHKRIYTLDNKTVNSDIWAENITVRKDSISFVAVDKSGEMMLFEIEALGKHNVQNLLGAILTAKNLGMSFAEIAEACKNITRNQGGMNVITGKYDIHIIDSSYSANPDGVIADLDYLNCFEGRKVIVMPCLIELGKKSADVHYRIGEKIGKICDMAIITTKDKFNEIKRGAVAKGMLDRNVILCDNPKDIFSLITIFCKSGDSVLLEGRVPAKLNDLLNQ